MARVSFEERNQQRIYARERGDYPTYASLTDELGVPPEDQQAYEVGELELKASENNSLDSIQRSSRRRSVSTAKYIDFLDEVQNMQPSIGNKREVLARYFPGRFGENGKTPLGKMSNNHVYGLYLSVVRYAEKRAEEANE